MVPITLLYCYVTDMYHFIDKRKAGTVEGQSFFLYSEKQKTNLLSKQREGNYKIKKY